MRKASPVLVGVGAAAGIALFLVGLLAAAVITF
jgi:hypothetical protein